MTGSTEGGFKHAALLADLARLLQKHGRPAFESLSEDLADPSFSASLSQVLAATANAQRTLPESSHPRRRTDPLERVRAQVLSIDDETAVLLKSTIDDMLTGESSLSLRDLKSFAESIDLQLAKSTKSRRDALAAVVRQVLSMPNARQLEVARELSATAATSPGSLEGWNSIIERSRNNLNEQTDRPASD